MCKIEEQKCSSFFCELYSLFFMRFLHFGFCAKKMTGAMSCRLKNTKCLEWRHLDIIKGLL